MDRRPESPPWNSMKHMIMERGFLSRFLTIRSFQGAGDPPICGILKRIWSVTKLLPTCIVLAACSTKYKPEDAIRIAQTYTELDWLPEARHIRHGADGSGIVVHTPDSTLGAHTGDTRGWWEPGIPAKGMPYKWGGFDTPESFLQGLREGKKAGDVANTNKVRKDNAVVSGESIGIDCSGFVSRCWGLTKPVSTRELPSLCDPVAWNDLRLGDIIRKEGHVLMFADRQGGYVIGYEAGPIPTWRARRCAIRINYLQKEGYSPWRYRNMAKPKLSGNETQYDINFPRGSRDAETQ